MFKSTAAKTPKEYIAGITDATRLAAIKKLDALIRKNAPKLKPHIRSGMIGYGEYHYKSASGREGDWFVIGLASQKNYISVFICAADLKSKKYLPEVLKDELGKVSVGKSCIRFKKLEDVNISSLTKAIKMAAKMKNPFEAFLTTAPTKKK